MLRNGRTRAPFPMAALTAALFGMAAPVARSTGARRAGPSTACILAALVLPPAAFLAAAARRYDGSPDVAFVDVGSFGTWGEGHTALSCNRAYAADVRIKHLELCRAAFPRTLVVAGDDLLRTEPRRDDPELVKRALELGMGLRDDSVLVDDMSRLAESERMAAAFRPTVPVIIEPATYDLFVSVGKPAGTPVIALPLPGHDGHHRYRLGAVTVASEPDGTP
jgi:hypothetical protein